MNSLFLYDAFLIFSLLWCIVFGGYFLVFCFKVLLPLLFFGALYVPSKENDIVVMIEMAGLSTGQKAVDLGAGDGRIVIALAKKGIEAHGYEINPALVFKANQQILKAGLQDKAFMHCANFWNQDISQFDIIVMYSIPFAMEKLENKLQKEAKSGAKIISNYFAFPTWKPVKRSGRIILYEK